MGPQASSKLLSLIVGMCSTDFNIKTDSEFPEIVLDSIPVPDFISDTTTSRLVINELKKRIKILERLDPICFAIACNTAHIFLPSLQKITKIPFISIIEEVSQTVLEQNIQTVGLLATPTTINTKLYERSLNEKGITVINPTDLQLKVIESVIRDILAGKLNETNKNKLIKVANSLKTRGAEGIILGCTELPLLFPQKFSIPIFDSIKILAQALLRKSIEK